MQQLSGKVMIKDTINPEAGQPPLFESKAIRFSKLWILWKKSPGVLKS